MNMRNGLEEEPHALIEVTGWMIVVSTLLWALMIAVAVRSGIITWVPWSGDTS